MSSTPQEPSDPIGRGDLAGLDAAARLASAPQLEEAVAGWTSQRSREETEQRLQALGIAAHRVQNSGECLTDPQLGPYTDELDPSITWESPWAIAASKRFWVPITFTSVYNPIRPKEALTPTREARWTTTSAPDRPRV